MSGLVATLSEQVGDRLSARPTPPQKSPCFGQVEEASLLLRLRSSSVRAGFLKGSTEQSLMYDNFTFLASNYSFLDFFFFL